MNVLGERQHPEKYLPLVINKVLKGEVLSVHSNKEKTKAGTRFYIHARNVAAGILHIINNCGERLDNLDASKGVFNIVGEEELDNLELAKIIAGFVGGELKYEMVDFHSSRPGHDLRYALDGKKMKGLGWEPPVSIRESIKNIVEWTLRPENKKWL
jgi:dTDP-glucose 4,6-dehydratase